MKIDKLQLAKGYSKVDNTKSLEAKDDFSVVLSGRISRSNNSNIKEDRKLDKIVDVNIEDIDADKTMESINLLLMSINMPLFEDKVADITELSEGQLVDISSDNTMISSLLDIDTMQIVDTSLINVNPREDFILEDNLIGREILASKSILEDKTTSLDNRSLQDATNLDTNSGNESINHISKYESNNKNFSIDNEFTQVNELNKINLEESIKIEDLNVTKATDEEVVVIKKEETIVEDKWINHNMASVQKVNVANDIEQQAKALSNENMQNINDSIIQLMEITTEGNANVMTVQLYPEELGAVNISLKMEDGKLIAKILVDDDYVKQLFTGKIELLNNNLVKQNINMEEIFVELNSNANSNPNGDSGQNNSNFSNQNKNFKFTSESIDVITNEEINLKSGELSILA